MPLKDFKQMCKVTMPLDPAKASLNTFLLDSLVALCTAFKCDFNINTNALLNAPTLRQGILEAMTLEDPVTKTLLRTNRKIEE